MREEKPPGDREEPPQFPAETLRGRDHETSGSPVPEARGEADAHPSDARRSPDEGEPPPEEVRTRPHAGDEPASDATAWNTEIQLSRAIGKDEAAQRRFVERFTPVIEQFARSLGFWPNYSRYLTTDDLVQEFWTAFWTDPERFEYRGKGSFPAWAQTVVTNLANGLLRKQNALKRGGNKQPESLVGDVGERAQLVCSGGGEPSPTSAARTHEILEIAWRVLTDQERLVFDLIAIQGHSSVTVAEELGRSDSRVRGIYARARRKLAQQF